MVFELSPMDDIESSESLNAESGAVGLAHAPKRMSKTRRLLGFTLSEVVISTALVGITLAMILGVVVILDRAVANERVLQLTDASGKNAFSAATLVSDWGYWEAKANPNWVPTFTVAPSRSADAQAAALWLAVNALYEKSTAVTMVPAFIKHNFANATIPNFPPPGSFTGESGRISGNIGGIVYPPMTYAQLTTPLDTANPADTNTMMGALRLRFPNSFVCWNPPAGIDTNSYRAATVFFLNTGDKGERIIGILRMRAWQFSAGSSNPYRYYEVGLLIPRWQSYNSSTGAIENPASPTSTWKLQAFPNGQYVEDYGYRFMEDRRFPQDLAFPPTTAGTGGAVDQLTGGNANNPSPVWLAQTDSNARDLFIRLARAGENYEPSDLGNGTAARTSTRNNNAGISRRQVSLIAVTVGASPFLPAGTDEWHLILPDPGIAQAEERARLRSNGATLSTDLMIRRQGKYCRVLSIYP